MNYRSSGVVELTSSESPFYANKTTIKCAWNWPDLNWWFLLKDWFLPHEATKDFPCDHDEKIRNRNSTQVFGRNAEYLPAKEVKLEILGKPGIRAGLIIVLLSKMKNEISWCWWCQVMLIIYVYTTNNQQKARRISSLFVFSNLWGF